nr:MAG TPA: hypothetical protein [Caudoviricetes sp.]
MLELAVRHIPYAFEFGYLLFRQFRPAPRFARRPLAGWRFERFDAYPGEMAHVHGQILAVRHDARAAACAAQQWVSYGGQPCDARHWPAQDDGHGQVITLNQPAVPRLPHVFPILDHVQAAAIADGGHEGTRFRDERAQPCGLAFTGAWPAHSPIAFLLAASNAILMMFSNHAPGSVMNFLVSSMAAAISSSVISRDAPALYPCPQAHCRPLSTYDGSRCFCASISLPMMLICPRFVVDCRFDSYAQVERLLPSGLVADDERLGRAVIAQARYRQCVERLLDDVNRFDHDSPSCAHVPVSIRSGAKGTLRECQPAPRIRFAGRSTTIGCRLGNGSSSRGRAGRILQTQAAARTWIWQ